MSKRRERVAVSILLCAVLAGAVLSRTPVRKPEDLDRLRPVTLKRGELAGEIGRRIDDIIYKNYMALDVDGFFIAPFRLRPFTDDYHYVGVGKVIDAGSLFSAYTGDPKVAERTSRLIDGIMQTRDADGYIGAFKPEPGGRQNHRNWALHEQEYLLLGLTRHGLAAGDKRSLRQARDLGDYVIRTFGQDAKPEEVCTAGLPEAFLLLYKATGEEKYLKFAAEVRHGNSKAEVQCASLLDWKQTFDSAAAHVYVMLARCYAQTELYRQKRMPSLLEMSAYMRHELLRAGGGLNVIGSASDGEWFSYSQNGAGLIGESCVTAYLVRWLDSLMRLEGDLRYGDIMERTIYNALFAAQDPEGRKIRYFTPFTGPRVYFNQDGFCCPGNFRRIMAELPQKVYYRSADGALAVNLYTACRTTVEMDKGLTVELSQVTDYPNSGHVVLQVTPSKEAVFAVRLRIPRWCRNAAIRINGGDPLAIPNEAPSFEIRRQWKAGDTVTLDMPMVWRFIKGHRLQEGKVALARGPVVYCLGTAQNEDILKKYPNFSGIVVDPSELGEPEADRSIRPDGTKVTVKARVEAPGAWSKGAPHLTLTFTEFVDPTGIVTFFPLLDLGQAVDDELMEDCFGDPQSRAFEPFVWTTAAPVDCPFPPSKALTGVLFKGVHSDYRFADTWYPSWAADGNLYSPYTDGDVNGVGSNSDGYASIDEKHEGSVCSLLRKATTGQAVLVGDDPLHLKATNLGTVQADPYPYGGRYPCGSLVHNGVWYYGTYTLAPHAVTRFGPTAYNWPWLGPLVGFRTSLDLGKTWRETPHTPAQPLFGEHGLWGYPVKIGAPHFVDFGRNMEHSPDGKAYLVAMGAEPSDPKPRFENLSWITADQVYLLRVAPSVETINDASKYEFYGGKDARGEDIWTRDLAAAKPLLEWNNRMGCVTVTYDAPLKKYLMCVTDGGNTCSRMSTYILEADRLTGPWRLVTFMKDFGQQAYFVNIPSKFIGPDGYSAWLCYSANFAPDWNNQKILPDPPGSRYGLVLQEIQLLTPAARRPGGPGDK